MTDKIYDAVHGFIHFNQLEKQLIDSEPFQRLHHLRQLGISFLVYPGATHTRFEHSLGTMELSTRIYDRLMIKYAQPLINRPYWRQILRLAALCHDLGHLPFSHVAEHVLLGEEGHEKWTLEIIQSPDLQKIWDELANQFPTFPVREDVIKMSIGPAKLQAMGVELPFSNWEQVLSQVITGDFFGADRIDYLLRDAQCTGVSYGLFDYHQLIEMLCILPNVNALALGIEENGIESCEALLLARHFMHQRVYQYPSVKSYTFHLARFMSRYYSQGPYLDSLDGYLSLTDNEILSGIRALSRTGDQDAEALMKKSPRFFAVDVGEEVGVSEMSNLQERLNIPRDAIVFSIHPTDVKKIDDEEQTFSFPVLSRSGAVVGAKRYSKIIIPQMKKNWVYIRADYKESLLHTLSCP